MGKLFERRETIFGTPTGVARPQKRGKDVLGP